MLQRCLNSYKKSCFGGKKEVFPKWFYSEVSGVWTVTEKVVSTVKKKVFSRCLYGEKKVFQRSSMVVFLKLKQKMSRNGWRSQRNKLVRCLYSVSTVTKIVVSTVKKEVVRKFFNSEQKTCSNGVWAVKKKFFDDEKIIFPQWFCSDQKGASTVFERLQQKVVSTVNKKRCFHSYFTVKKRCFNGLSMVVFCTIFQRCFNGDNKSCLKGLAKNMCFSGEK